MSIDEPRKAKTVSRHGAYARIDRFCPNCMKKNCSDCSMAHAIEDGVIECEADKYDIHTKSCFVPKLCKIEKNQRLIEHIMEFDSQGKEYDWYEQHIALMDGERKDGERRTDEQQS